MQDPNQPLITFITVVYNGVTELEQTIQSILAQTDKRFEYFIIDGGSTDGTIDLIKKYESILTGWISEKDNGLYDAMNKGMKMGTGQYLWFMNAGDQVYAKNTVEKLFYQEQAVQEEESETQESGNKYQESRGEQIESRDKNQEAKDENLEVRFKKQESRGLVDESGDANEKIVSNLPDIIYGETEIINEQGTSLGLRRLKAPEQLNWKSLQWGMVVCHQSFLVKREKCLAYNPAFLLASDIDWMIRVLKASSTIHNSHQVLCKFKAGGLSHQNIHPGLKERFRIMVHHYGFFKTILNHGVLGTRFFFYYLRHRRI